MSEDDIAKNQKIDQNTCKMFKVRFSTANVWDRVIFPFSPRCPRSQFFSLNEIGYFTSSTATRKSPSPVDKGPAD